MASKHEAKLPSPMDFPAEIRPITAREIGDLYQAFGVNNRKRMNAEVRYERLSAQIAMLTGHEHTQDRHGNPYSRAEWQEAIHKSLRHLNEELKLGMDPQVINVLTLCYTALQESPRYSGDPVIESKKGENTAVHSLHTMLQAFRVYQKTLEAKPELSHNIEFFRSFQMTCLMMAVHDLGEMLGEAGSLAQVASTGNWGVKDKSDYERMVFNFGVREAIHIVIDKGGTEEDFFEKIDAIRAGSNIQNQGVTKTDSEMVSEVGKLMKSDVRLSARGRKLFDFLHTAWETVEDPKNSANPFLGFLAANCERVQGTRHINRMLATSKSPYVNDRGDIGLITTHSLTPGYRLLTNSDYSEGHLGKMCASIDPSSPFEKNLAEQAAAWVYETVADFYRSGPEAFFIDGSFKESRLHNDGSAFTPQEVKKRLAEIERAKIVAGSEKSEIIKGTKDNALTSLFQQNVIPLGRAAVLREDVVAMYERAIEARFLPGVVEKDGKSRSMILVRDMPVELVTFSRDDVGPYKGKTKKQIDAVRAELS